MNIKDIEFEMFYCSFCQCKTIHYDGQCDRCNSESTDGEDEKPAHNKPALFQYCPHCKVSTIMVDFECSECGREFDCDLLSDVELEGDELIFDSSEDGDYYGGPTSHDDICYSDADPGL